MPTHRYSLSITLILCLILQGSSLSFAAANGVLDCGMDMQQMDTMQMIMQSSPDHAAVHHEQTSPMSMEDTSGQLSSNESDCCDVNDATRSDCTDMPDCHSCGSMITLSIPTRSMTLTAAPAITKQWLHPPTPKNQSPPDLWRPPIAS